MDITKKVAAMRLKYHMNMLDVNNVLNQLRIRNSLRAERIGKKHAYACLDCLERLGYDVQLGILEEA